MFTKKSALSIAAITASLTLLFPTTASAGNITSGITECSHTGTVLEVRFTDANSTPVQVQLARSYNLEIDFRSAANHASFQSLLTLAVGGLELPYLNQSNPQSLTAGSDYTATFAVNVVAGVVGGATGNFRAEVRADGVNEVCVIVPAQFTV
ncbi:hypothetical protein [Nocardia brasiliensis]|uniref:hypothetical protein n=1 Tax=Nocardia brasiliensis TaxID=37326 RepID=UPI002458B5CF|nr:hypothetical protein [Nocardia brasiliensis]